MKTPEISGVCGLVVSGDNTLNYYEKKVIYIKKKLAMVLPDTNLRKNDDFQQKRRFLMSEVELIDIFADNLRDLMSERGFSQRELERESGINHASISRYLKKERIPTVKALINLAFALECDLDELVPTYDYVD